MHKLDLSADWVMTATGGPVPAEILGKPFATSVPATSHTVLLEAGAIPDPYLERNEEVLSWFKHATWRFARELTIAPLADGERADLVFDGIDTVATVALGGAELASVRNMHRSYRLNVDQFADGTARELGVDFGSALAYAHHETERLGHRPCTYPQPFNMVRKMACSFGWDWGPDLQTAGLWRPVRLERWQTARLAQVRPLVDFYDDGATGRLRLNLEVEWAQAGATQDLEVSVDLSGAGVEVSQTFTVPAGETAVSVEVAVPNAPRWWPVGYGAQPLVHTEVKLVDREQQLDGWSRDLGFRTLEINTTPDEYGTPFTFIINGEPVYVKGANWIPDDHLLTRITRERLAERIDQALEANMNMLRIWGGGIYESEDFYELCDRAGVLVWQDFLLACAAYPEEEPFRSEFEAEARENVVRLMAHPSLVLFNGGNENLWGFMDWGWPEELEGRTWGLHYYREVFPKVVSELAPLTPYSDGSPYSPEFDLEEVHPNNPNHGTHHEWDVWNRIDYTNYRNNIPRFASEFGFQAPPPWSTLVASVAGAADPGFDKADETFLLHQKADDGNGKLDRGLEPHLGIPAKFADWHWATQLNQARAVTYAINHYRSWWPRNAGSIIWQINDCWPVTSWAAIDSNGLKKPLFYALAQSYADRLLTVQPREAGLALSVVNDSPTAWEGTVELSRQTIAGEVLATAQVEVSVAKRAVETIILPAEVAQPGDETAEILVAGLGDLHTVHTWVPDVQLQTTPRPFQASAQAVAGGYAVVVKADEAVLGLSVLADRVAPDAQADRGVIDLPAGGEVTFSITTSAQVDPELFLDPAVLRSGNDAVAAARQS